MGTPQFFEFDEAERRVGLNEGWALLPHLKPSVGLDICWARDYEDGEAMSSGRWDRFRTGLAKVFCFMRASCSRVTGREAQSAFLGTVCARLVSESCGVTETKAQFGASIPQ